MIQKCVNKLIDNLPADVKNVKKPIVIDLVLDGGLFNGSYHAGALHFLKEMEKRKYIKVDRISGCSIGAFVAFLYFIDELDLMSNLYVTVIEDFKKCHQLKIIKTLKELLKGHFPENVCSRLNKKLFICYNNIAKREKVIKSKYKNTDEICDAIIKSCFIPYLVDGKCLYRNKYIDGINPYIFEPAPNKKILYLDLFGYDKIFNLINIKNENSNYHRIIYGMLDIHYFFIKKNNTPMCSYVNDWNYLKIIKYYVKLLIEKFCVYLTYFFILTKKAIYNEQPNNFFYKLFAKMFQSFFVVMLETHCF